MTSKRLKISNPDFSIKCTTPKCQRRAAYGQYKARPAKYEYDGVYYCGKCYKKVNSALRIVAGKGQYKDYRKSWTKRIAELRRRATPAEKALLTKLRKVCPVKFKFQRAFIKGGYYAIVDFHIPSRNICIEVDGGYHGTIEQRNKDKRRDMWLGAVRKQDVRRITNQQAIDMSLADVLALCYK